MMKKLSEIQTLRLIKEAHALLDKIEPHAKQIIDTLRAAQTKKKAA